MISSPLPNSSRLTDDYLLQHRCQATDYPLTSPTPYVLGTTTVSHPRPSTTSVRSSYTCHGKYVVQPGDTCLSVSRKNQVSTYALIYINKLAASCRNFPAPGTEICLPQSCSTYTATREDTSVSVSQRTGLSVEQLQSYNIDLNMHRGNVALPPLREICLSPPGEVATTQSWTRVARPT